MNASIEYEIRHVTYDDSDIREPPATGWYLYQVIIGNGSVFSSIPLGKLSQELTLNIRQCIKDNEFKISFKG